LEEIRTVALDTSSLTSVSLLKVLFHRWWGEARSFTSVEPDIKKMLAEHDAGLLIGDPALRIDRSEYHTYDLAEEWLRLTGKPFVFAFWAVREGAARETALDLASIFQTSRDHGLESSNLALVARQWAPRVGLSENEVRSYLTENIHYYLDPDCVEGLQLFYRYAHECGVLPPAPPLHLLEIHKPVPSPTL
jgi:chorismate dehydratase